MATRSYLLILVTALFACLYFTPQSHAQNQEAWMKQFEATFTASSKVGRVLFMHPKQFELAETTMGVFLEAKEISGQISQGSVGVRTKEDITELLVKKQGGKGITESFANGHAVFASTSIQGEQTCRAYIVVLKDTEEKPLYIQFRWKSENPVDYTPMLDRLVATMK